MAEAVTYTNSIRFHNRNTERLREFRRTINQRNGKRKGHSSQNQEVFQEEEVKESTATCCSPGPVRWGYKNVYAASISFMLVFSAFVGLQNLQSSLNRRLGTTSLALTYVFYLFIGFATPGMVRLLKTKYSLLFGYICHTIYILSNFYPSFYTLVPSSIILGIGSGPVWAGLSTHLASVAVIVTPHTAETFNVLISKFTGLFFFIFQLTQILGNLVSSLVLFPYNSGENSTALVEVEMMPIELCNYGEARGISSMQTYILLSIYVFFDLLGIALLVIVVDKLPEDNGVDKMKSKVKVYCTEPFVDLLRLLFSQNMLLLGPLSLYNGLELSFAYSSYTQNIISDCVGVSKVGFALIVLGFFSAIMSIIYGKAVKYIPRLVMGSLAAIINLFFLLFLQFYPLRPSFPLIFLFAIFWGLADGVWNTLTASLVGVLFPSDQEAGFSAFRIWMSLGFAIGFVTTEVKVLSQRLWIMVAVLVFSFVLYCILEVTLFYKRKKSKDQTIQYVHMETNTPVE